jgi:hypothetical protein
MPVWRREKDEALFREFTIHGFPDRQGILRFYNLQEQARMVRWAM